MGSLAELKKQIQACNRCPLAKNMMAFPSIGVGSTRPDIVFVLGGVDRESVVLGKPFNSRDELLLLTALAKAGIDKSRCYVTPIIRCGNVTNHKKNVVDCIDWLKHELDLLQPKCLFFLSDAAYKLFVKLCPSNIKTFGMSSTLAGIFNRNSLMTEFVNKLKEMNEFCTKV